MKFINNKLMSGYVVLVELWEKPESWMYESLASFK